MTAKYRTLKNCCKKMGVIRSLFSNSVPACNAKCFLPSCAQNAPNLNNRQKFLLCSKNYLALFVCQGYDFSVKSLQIIRACKMKNKTKMDSFDIISFYCNSKKSSASNDQFAQRNWGEFLTTQTKTADGNAIFCLHDYHPYLHSPPVFISCHSINFIHNQHVFLGICFMT